MKKFWILFGIALLAGCASQRQKPVCAEIEYRLNHSAMSPEQREWTAEELRQCRAEQEEYEQSDSLTNKFKKSIYELYAESKKDSIAKADSAQSLADSSSSVISDQIGNPSEENSTDSVNLESRDRVESSEENSAE